MLLSWLSSSSSSSSAGASKTRKHRHQNAYTTSKPTCDLNFGLTVINMLLIICLTISTNRMASGNSLVSHSDNQNCDSLWRRAGESRAATWLVFLNCEIKPLYELFVAAHHDSKAPSQIDNDLETGQEFAKLARTIGEFTEEALDVLQLGEFCVYSTFNRFKRLQQLASDSKLLGYGYDLVAIELHTHCLGQTISKLPAVPYLVADVVKIYIEGADAPLPDLNGPPAGHSNEMELDEEEGPFDVDAAIAANGPLELVVNLSLSMGMGAYGLPTGSAEVTFRDTCRKFVMGIQENWDSMEMMNTMVATDGNAIKHVNNFVARTLSPIKYADICTKISARS